MAPSLYCLGHVALATPDLEESLAFFRDAVGLEETARAGDAVYLRGVDEFVHHSIRLREAEEAGVDHVGWRAAEPDDVDAFAEHLEGQGIDVSRVEAGEELGQGEAIRFRTPTGHRFEIFHEMATPEAEGERRSKLRNRPYAAHGNNPVAPRRIDHVQVWDTDALGLAEWMVEHLGFREQEHYDRADGSRWGTFISACDVKIDAAIIQHEGEDGGDGNVDGRGEPELNHVAFRVDRGDDLFDAADAMREQGYPTDGFGQHSISRGKFCYARDPTSGHRLEFSAGGYLVFDPTWEPVAWEEDDLEDRQWIGGLDGGPGVTYSGD